MEGAAACGNVGAAACGGGGGGIGLRAGAVADRGGGAEILGRGFCSEALASEAFSEVLAISRDICCWLALSCSTLALSCPISCPMVARSRAIDCGNCADSADTAAAPAATPCAAVCAGGAGCAGAAVTASASTAGGAGCTGSAGFSRGCDDVKA